MRHTYSRLYAHLVWATWDRAPLLIEDVRPRVFQVMQHQASLLGAEVLAIGGVDDHVHVLVRFPPKLAIATLVGRMKGASSHMVSQIIGLPFRWQGAYGAFSVSTSALPRVRAYVLNQEQHHRDRTAHPMMELPEEQEGPTTARRHRAS